MPNTNVCSERYEIAAALIIALAHWLVLLLAAQVPALVTASVWLGVLAFVIGSTLACTCYAQPLGRRIERAVANLRG